MYYKLSMLVLVLNLMMSFALPAKAQEIPQDPEAELQATLQSLLDAQKDLSPLVVDSALQVPNCFEVASLDDDVLPTGSKNLVLVDDRGGAQSGAKYYRQIAPGNAQLPLTPRQKAPGRKLFFRLSVRNTGLLDEPLAKIETINSSTAQAGMDIIHVAGRAGWQTFSGSMVADGDDAWVLTFLSAMESFALQGTFEFDAISVIACDTARGYLPTINFGVICPNERIGRVMGFNETVEQVANQQLIPPQNITLMTSGSTRLACWASRQTQAYYEGETLDFHGADRRDSWNDFIVAFVIPAGAAIADVKPGLVTEVVASSNKGPTGFSSYQLGRVAGLGVILGHALDEFIEGMTGYLQHKSEKYLNPPVTFLGRSGEQLITHVPSPRGTTGAMKIYNLSNFPTSAENMKKVVAYTCIAYCDSAFIHGWVLVAAADTITGGTVLVQNVTYERYIAMLEALGTRLLLAPSPVLEQTKVQLVDDIGDFVDETNDDIGDLPPIEDGPEGELPTDRCEFHIAGELPGTDDLAWRINAHIMQQHVPYADPPWAEYDMWRNLKDVIEKGRLVPSFDDITFQHQRPAPIGSGGYWALPLIDRTISYICTPPKFPDMLPFALFEIDALIPGVHRYPYVWPIYQWPVPEAQIEQ